eukprot:gene11870-14974_t
MLGKQDIDNLKAYVAGGTGQNVAESTVLLHVSHSNLDAKFYELRFDKHMNIESLKMTIEFLKMSIEFLKMTIESLKMSIESLKVKLSFHCGTNASAMMLQLLDESGTVVAMMADDSKMLGFFSPYSGYTIHIIDTDPQSASVGGWLEDTSLVDKYRMPDEEYGKKENTYSLQYTNRVVGISLVDKYRMPDEEYGKKENTYRRWKADKIATDPEWTLEKEIAMNKGVEYVPPPPKQSDPDFMKAEASSISVGQRCSVDPGDRRGEVKFVGNGIDGLPMGFWIGICYDEPLGKNDGNLKGKKYFDAPHGFGAFVRPDKVKCSR